MLSEALSFGRICLLLTLTLSTALVLAHQSTFPTLEVGECFSVEPGTPVQVFGVVVEVRSYDSGTEILSLMDRGGGPCLRVICLPQSTISLSEELRIGDLVRVEGEVSRDATDIIVFADKNRVTQVLRPEFVLSVELLCENWRVFEYDRFNVSGAVLSDGDITRLQGFSGSHSIEMRCQDALLPPVSGAHALVDCTLLIDPRSMVIFLQAHSISAGI
jgi:hypothetical protein